MEHKEPNGKLVPYCNLTEKPDASIETVKKAMQGDKEAFSALFMQTYRPMYLVVKSYLRRDEDIYDALQNGYTKAYKYLSRLQTPEAFFTWLKKTMENAARDIRADITGRESLHEDMEEFADELTVEYAESSERRADIQEVLSQLDPKQAEVLTLHYYDGMKASEIARLLDEPQSTIYSRLAAAKKVLIERLKAKGIDKSLYSGSVSAMIAVSLRTLIGTDVLSAATAQQMLDDILGGHQGHLGAAAYKLLEAQRNRAILRAVSLLMGLTVLVSCVTVAFLNGIPWKWLSSLPVGTHPIESSQRETLPGGWRETTTTLSPGVLPPDDPLNTAPGFTMPTFPTDEEGRTLFPPASTDSQGSRDPTVSGGESTGPSGSSAGTYPTVPGKITTSSSGSKTSAGSSNPPTLPTVPAGTFVPDYRPGKANTKMRNQTGRNRLGHERTYLNGNLTEGIWVDRQDEWIYVFDSTRESVYKRRFDGTGSVIPLPVKCSSLVLNGLHTVMGDWIYYIWDGDLLRVRTDGAVTETVSSFEGTNGWVYWFVVENNQVRYCSSELISSGFGSTSYYAVREYLFSADTGKRQLVDEQRVYGDSANQPYSVYWLNNWLVLLRPIVTTPHVVDSYTVTAEHRTGGSVTAEKTFPLLAGEKFSGIGMPIVAGNTMYATTIKEKKYKCDFSGSPAETLYCPVKGSTTGDICKIDFIDSMEKKWPIPEATVTVPCRFCTILWIPEKSPKGRRRCTPIDSTSSTMCLRTAGSSP